MSNPVPTPAHDSDAVIVAVYQGPEHCLNIAPDEELDVLSAMRTWVSSGHTRNTLLSLTLRSGAEYSVLASQLTAVIKSTPESRQRGQLLTKRDIEEHDEHQREAGFIPGDDAR